MKLFLSVEDLAALLLLPDDTTGRKQRSQRSIIEPPAWESHLSSSDAAGISIPADLDIPERPVPEGHQTASETDLFETGRAGRSATGES